jgi:starch synthase
MVADPAAAKRMGEAGRQRARERFDWGRIAEQTREVYETVIAERAARPAR